MKRIVLVAASAWALLLPTLASAQGGPGFLFNRPRVSIGFRTGYTIPKMGSNLFEQSRTDFTLNRWDFAGPYVGGDLAARVSDHLDVTLTGGWAQGNGLSEYRELIECSIVATPCPAQNQLPIEQETTFQTVSASLGGRYYFTDRGRSVGRFAWVPARLAPFVGGGVGMMWYDFIQKGDFVDFQTLDIFGDELETSGHGASLYASAGADLSIGKQFYLTGEARYNLASAGVRDSYSLYDRMDLSGLQLTTGISLRW
jgi:hypothetical protein